MAGLTYGNLTQYHDEIRNRIPIFINKIWQHDKRDNVFVLESGKTPFKVTQLHLTMNQNYPKPIRNSPATLLLGRMT